MPLYPEIEGLDVEGLKAAFEGEPLDGPEYYRAFYDEVAIRIRQRGGSDEVEYLLGWVHRDDPRRIPSVFAALT